MIQFRQFRKNPSAPRIFASETARIRSIGRGIIELTLVVPRPCAGVSYVFDEVATITTPYASLVEGHDAYDWALEEMKRQAH